MDTIVIEDAGWIFVKIGEVENRLDLLCVHNRIAEFSRQLNGEPIHLLHTKVAELLVELGYPPASNQVAASFIEQIRAALAKLRQEDGSSPPAGATGEAKA